MRNYGIPPINGISELLAIESRSLPHGSTKLCQVAAQPPAWFTFFKKNVDDYQDLELSSPIQGAWISQNKSVIVSSIETESAPKNILAKAILATPDRNIHQFQYNSWRILFGSSIIGTIDPNGTATPDFAGQIYIDSINSNVYISNGLTNNNWYLAGTGGGSGS